MMKLRKKKLNHQGQAMTEYMIITAVVALAALTMFSLFGDTIRAKMRGVISAFGGQATSTQGEEVTSGSSKETLIELDQDGSGDK